MQCDLELQIGFALLQTILFQQIVEQPISFLRLFQAFLKFCR